MSDVLIESVRCIMHSEIDIFLRQFAPVLKEFNFKRIYQDETDLAYESAESPELTVHIGMGRSDDQGDPDQFVLGVAKNGETVLSTSHEQLKSAYEFGQWLNETLARAAQINACASEKHGNSML